MNSTYLVTVCEKRYYQAQVSAPDDEVIFNFQDPDKARFIPNVDRLKHPEYYSSPFKTEVEILDAILGVEP